MTISLLMRARARAYLIFSSGFFVWTLTKLDVVKSVVSNSGPAGIVVELLAVTLGAIGAILLFLYARKAKASDEATRRALKDEWTTSEITNALKISYCVMLLFVFSMYWTSGFGLSTEDCILLIMAMLIVLPFFIFAVRDKLND